MPLLRLLVLFLLVLAAPAAAQPQFPKFTGFGVDDANVLPPETEVLWQTGATDTRDLPIEARGILPADELVQAMRAADVVVAHAGIGSALTALDAEKVPVLVPRLHSRGEQNDDHQTRIAAELARMGLAIAATSEALDLGTLREAAGRGVVRLQRPLPFELG